MRRKSPFNPFLCCNPTMVLHLVVLCVFPSPLVSDAHLPQWKSAGGIFGYADLVESLIPSWGKEARQGSSQKKNNLYNEQKTEIHELFGSLAWYFFLETRHLPGEVTNSGFDNKMYWATSQLPELQRLPKEGRNLSPWLPLAQGGGGRWGARWGGREGGDRKPGPHENGDCHKGAGMISSPSPFPISSY